MEAVGCSPIQMCIRDSGMDDFKGNIIFTTHDHQMIQTVANRIIEFTEEGIIDRPVTYDEYLELMKKED